MTPLRPRRILLFAATLGLLLAASTAGGYVRERAALPGAARSLRAASQASSEVLSCLQGVQDELAGGKTAANVRNARAALRLCGLGPLERAVAEIHLPIQAPFANMQLTATYHDIVQATAVLHRQILDARAAELAMSADLTGLKRATTLILSYRAFVAGDQRSSALSVLASGDHP